MAVQDVILLLCGKLECWSLANHLLLKPCAGQAAAAAAGAGGRRGRGAAREGGPVLAQRAAARAGGAAARSAGRQRPRAAWRVGARPALACGRI